MKVRQMSPFLVTTLALSLTNNIASLDKIASAGNEYAANLTEKETANTQKEEENALVFQNESKTSWDYEYVDPTALSTASKEWYFLSNKTHSVPSVAKDIDLKKYNAFYVGNTSEKEIYLTFDEGYENGYTPQILNTLKFYNVKATFFCTLPFMKANPELVKKMKEEGHIVASHSINHKRSSTLSADTLKSEIEGPANYYKELTGEDMPKFFRPPEGEYSERSLAITNNMGYRTIFWSFAYKDWVTTAQPAPMTAYNTVMEKYHNGCIMLLHAVSSANAKSLGWMIDSLQKEGYTFKTLYDLPE